jgi:DNA-binding NtrC family response regulator
MNGIAFAEQFQAARPEASVIYMSGYANPEQYTIPSGARFIQKPMDITTLQREVKAALNIAYTEART